MDKWYRHRIVKRVLLPGLRWANAYRKHSDIKTAKATLGQQAKAEMSAYLMRHYPGQILLAEFIKPRLDGTEVFVVLTLYGPPNIEDEIISELAERGEA